MTWVRLLVPLILLLAPMSALAMTGDKAELQKLADGVYAFVGKRNDANAVVIVTTQGVVLVDTKMPGNVPYIVEQVKKITDIPIKLIINTHSHPDHVGRNDYLREQ